MKQKKIIIWGYPHYDTLNHVFESMYAAIKHLGYEVYYFNNKTYLSNFDYENSIFITEGKACQNMPILKSCTYLIHYLHEPLKYLGNVGKLIDLRYLCDGLNDPGYTWKFDSSLCEKLDSGVYYEKDSNYDKVYMAWATNLLPHEINIEDSRNRREMKFNFVGSVSASHEYGQSDELSRFVNECVKNGIEYKHYNPWHNPQTELSMKKLVQESYLAPDFRGPKHKAIGIKPCRIFKNISLGQLGLTNSIKVHEFLEGATLYTENEADLFYLGKENKENFSLIEEQMNLIKTKHTYINRMENLIKLLV